MNDQLLQAARVGLEMERQEMVRSELARDISREAKTLNARSQVSAIAAEFDPDREDAPLLLGRIAQTANPLPAQEYQSMLEPLQRKLEEREAFEKKARAYGVKPIYAEREDGVRVLDRGATFNAIEAAKLTLDEEAQTWLPDTNRLKVRLMEDPVFSKMDPIAQRQELAEQDAMLRGLNEANRRGLITADERNRVLQQVVQPDGTRVVLGDGRLDRYEYDALVAPKLRELQKQEQARDTSKQAVEGGSTLEKMYREQLRILQALSDPVYGAATQMTEAEKARIKEQIAFVRNAMVEAGINVADAAATQITGSPTRAEGVVNRMDRSAVGAVQPENLPISALKNLMRKQRDQLAASGKSTSEMDAMLDKLAPGKTVVLSDGRRITATDDPE